MFASRSLKASLAALLLTLPLLAHADAAQDAGAKELAATLNINNMLPDLAQRTTASALPLLQEYLVKNKIQLTEAQQKKAQAGLKAMATTSTSWPPITSAPPRSRPSSSRPWRRTSAPSSAPTS
ncbi:hypothetical protein [Chromobacterium subtsugae]|uniref:hypothetical protein n=1 Tax=Chromobacterium subtsugae TaxID=251747 RepID=UPI000640DCAB|nr:hypothetical protein [Chromobacterium subtsugae]